MRRVPQSGEALEQAFDVRSYMFGVTEGYQDMAPVAEQAYAWYLKD